MPCFVVRLKTGPISGIERAWCSKHYPEPDELSNSRSAQLAGISSRLSKAYNLAEDNEDRAQLLRDAIEEFSSQVDELRESVSNLPESLQQSEQAQARESWADNLESWCSEHESTLDGIDLKEDDAADNLQSLLDELGNYPED